MHAPRECQGAAATSSSLPAHRVEAALAIAFVGGMLAVWGPRWLPMGDLGGHIELMDIVPLATLYVARSLALRLTPVALSTPGLLDWVYDLILQNPPSTTGRTFLDSNGELRALLPGVVERLSDIHHYGMRLYPDHTDEWAAAALICTWVLWMAAGRLQRPRGERKSGICAAGFGAMRSRS